MAHIVFGGSSGIGSLVVNELIRIVENDVINVDLLPSNCSMISENWVGDLANRRFVQDIIARLDELTRIDSILWAIRYRNPGLISDVEILHGTLVVELFPVIAIFESISQKIVEDSPSVCLLSSIASKFVSSQHLAYSIVKSSHETLARNLAVKYGDVCNARFNTISPGIVDLPLRSDALSTRNPQATILERAAIPRLSPVKGIELAKLIIFLLSDNSSALNGANLLADGGETLLDQYFVAERTLRLLSK